MPNPFHFHIVHQINIPKSINAKLVNNICGSFNVTNTNKGFSKASVGRKLVSKISIRESEVRMINIEIPMKTLQDFIRPFILALDLNHLTEFKNTSAQTTYHHVKELASQELESDKGNRLIDRDYEEHIITNMHDRLIQDLTTDANNDNLMYNTTFNDPYHFVGGKDSSFFSNLQQDNIILNKNDDILTEIKCVKSHSIDNIFCGEDDPENYELQKENKSVLKDVKDDSVNKHFIISNETSHVKKYTNDEHIDQSSQSNLKIENITSTDDSLSYDTSDLYSSSYFINSVGNKEQTKLLTHSWKENDAHEVKPIKESSKCELEGDTVRLKNYQHCSEVDKETPPPIKLTKNLQEMIDWMKKVEEIVKAISEIILKYVVEKCYDLQNDMLFPEFVPSQNIMKMFNTFKDIYDNNLSFLSNEELTYLKTKTILYTMTKIETNLECAHSLECTSIKKLKMIGLSKFVLDILNIFFNKCANVNLMENFKYFSGTHVTHSTPLKGDNIPLDTDTGPYRHESISANVKEIADEVDNNAHSTPSETDNISPNRNVETGQNEFTSSNFEKIIGKTISSENTNEHMSLKFENKKCVSKLRNEDHYGEEDIKLFQKKKSSTGNELYWVTVDKSPISKRNNISSKSNIVNIDEIPLRPPNDIATLTPISEEPQFNVVHNDGKKLDEIAEKSDCLFDFRAGGDHLLFGQFNNSVIGNEVTFTRNTSTTTNPYFEKANVLYLRTKKSQMHSEQKSNPESDISDDSFRSASQSSVTQNFLQDMIGDNIEDNWMGYEAAKF